MKKGEWEGRPDSWHVILCAGSVVMVDTEVRKEVESWLKGLEYPRDYFAQLTIETIIGEEMTIIASSVSIIYDTTPEKRGKSRDLDDQFKAERLEQGFPDE
jgi:hypothetical protein